MYSARRHHSPELNCRLLVLGLVTAGCLPERSVEPQRSPGLARAIPVEQMRRVRTSDDDLAELADRLPGFGGYYYDQQQILNVWLKDPGHAAEAQVQVGEFLRRRAGRARDWTEVNAARVSGMRVRQAQYDFRQLLTWYRGHVLPNVMGLQGITMTDIDERVNRIQVGVGSTAYLEATRQFLARLPIPPDAVEVTVEAAAYINSSSASSFMVAPTMLTTRNLNDTLRPVVGGAKITGYIVGGGGAGQTCTLGFNLVAWIGGEVEPERYLVTNSHCVLPWGQMTGASVAQPTANDWIGTEVADPAFFSCSGIHPMIPSNHICRFNDAVLIEYTNAENADHGTIAVPAIGQTTFTSTTSIIEVYAPEVGRQVDMVGRVSGRKVGTVVRSCTHARVAGTNQWFLCQGRTSFGGQTGDSGAPIIERLGDGSAAYGVGIHWSSGGYFSPLYSLLDELAPGIGLLDPVSEAEDPPALPSPPPDFEVAVYGMTLVGPTTVCTWTAVVTGGEAPLEYTWSGLLSGTDSYVIGGISSSGYLEVTVVDALGVERSGSLLIDYDPEASIECQ